MAKIGKVKSIYGGPVAKRLEVELTEDVLAQMGKCIVDAFVREAKKDFAKRGWSGEAKDGSKPIWDSFSYVISGKRTIEVRSTFPDIDVLVSRDIPPRDLEWLTQQDKDARPTKYELTDRERRAGAKKSNRMKVDPKTGQVRIFPPSYVPRHPLVVPLKSRGGTVVFRMAPLKTANAWVHPGIARFTFADRAVRTGKAKCIQIMKKEAIKALVQAMSS